MVARMCVYARKRALMVGEILKYGRFRPAPKKGEEPNRKIRSMKERTQHHSLVSRTDRQTDRNTHTQTHQDGLNLEAAFGCARTGAVTQQDEPGMRMYAREYMYVCVCSRIFV